MSLWTCQHFFQDLCLPSLSLHILCAAGACKLPCMLLKLPKMMWVSCYTLNKSCTLCCGCVLCARALYVASGACFIIWTSKCMLGKSQLHTHLKTAQSHQYIHATDVWTQQSSACCLPSVLPSCQKISKLFWHLFIFIDAVVLPTHLNLHIQPAVASLPWTIKGSSHSHINFICDHRRKQQLSWLTAIVWNAGFQWHSQSDHGCTIIGNVIERCVAHCQRSWGAHQVQQS